MTKKSRPQVDAPQADVSSSFLAVPNDDDESSVVPPCQVPNALRRHSCLLTHTPRRQRAAASLLFLVVTSTVSTIPRYSSSSLHSLHHSYNANNQVRYISTWSLWRKLFAWNDGGHPVFLSCLSTEVTDHQPSRPPSDPAHHPSTCRVRAPTTRWQHTPASPRRFNYESRKRSLITLLPSTISVHHVITWCGAVRLDST